MSLDACAAMVARSDPDRFAAAMLAPMPARGHLMALYAFNLEVARAPWVTAEPVIAQMRLQWWRDAVAEIFAGGAVRRHEVVTPLAAAVAAAELPRDPLDAMIDAREKDIARPKMTPEQAFAYCGATTGNLVQLAVRALGGRGEARHAARFHGEAQGAANFGRALPGLYAANWHALSGWPGADLNGANPTVPLAGAIGALGDLGMVALMKARERRRQLPRSAGPAILAGWRSHAVLATMTHPTGRETMFRRDFETGEARRRLTILLRHLTGSW